MPSHPKKTSSNSAASAAAETGVRPGRPRDPEINERILQETRRLLAEHGYTRMSVDAVASAVGVSRPTIYLRWPSKEKLVIAAISDLERAEDVPLSGDTYADLRRVLNEVQVSFVDHGNARLIGPIQIERQHSPELFEEFQKKLLKPRRSSLRRIVEQGIAAGVIFEDLNVDTAVNAIIGSLYAKLMTGEDVPSDFADQVIAMVWRGLSPTG